MLVTVLHVSGSTGTYGALGHKAPGPSFPGRRASRLVGVVERRGMTHLWRAHKEGKLGWGEACGGR